MTEQTTTVPDAFEAEPAAAYEPAAGSGCCRTATAAAEPTKATEPCCGTAREAGDAGSCCGHAAKADAIGAGVGCCG
jgi:hypothetical protein